MVDPMASDQTHWTKADYEVFGRLLRIKDSQFISHTYTLDNRQQYFSEINHFGDIFLDPDTGIATGRVAGINKYIKPIEIVSLLNLDGNRLIAIYQHVRAINVSVRVDQCVSAVKEISNGFGWCSYETTTVAMLFFCADKIRTEEVHKALFDLLGVHANRRVRINL